MIDERKERRNFYLTIGLLFEAMSIACFTMRGLPRQALDSPKETSNPVYFSLGVVLCAAGLFSFWRARKNHLSAMNALNAPALINQLPTVQGTPPSSVQDVKLAYNSQAGFFSRAKQAASAEVTLEIEEDKAEDKRVQQNVDKDDLSSSVSYLETDIETENNAATIKNGLS